MASVVTAAKATHPATRESNGLLVNALTEAIGSRLDGLHDDLREMSRSQAALASSVRDLQTQYEGVGRLTALIDRNTADWMAWRKEHEAENAKTGDKVKWFSGVFIGFAVAAGLVIGLAGAYVTNEFANVRTEAKESFIRAADERRRIEQTSTTERSRIQDQVNELRIRIDETQKVRGAL